MPVHHDAALVPHVALRLADALFDAIAANDLDRLRTEVYAPEIVVWHNNDQHEQHIDENLSVLNWLHRNVRDKRYENVIRQVTPRGFVEQHVLRGTAPDGTSLDIHACLVVTVTDGRISRIDEYIDSAAIASLLP